MNTKFTKNVEWLKPFVKQIGYLAPLSKLQYIRGYKVRKGLNELAWASITKYSANRYTISLRVESLVKNGRKHKPSTIETTLLSLAHELAHLKHWEHTPEHFKLQARIISRFSLLLKKNRVYDHSKSVKTLQGR